MLKNDPCRYGLVAKIFHWLSAIVIFFLFILGVWMIDLDYEHYWYDSAIHYHESIGILFSIFLFLRLCWSWFSVKPIFPKTLSSFERRAAVITHRLLYLLCVTIVVSGYLIPTADTRGITVFTWFTVPSIGGFHHQQADFAGQLHYWLSYSLIALVLLHMLASFKHHFIDKDNTLRRIL